MNAWMTNDQLRELIVNLTVLGEVEDGVKLNTKEKYLILDNTTWYQSVLRWYRGDSRKTTVNKVSKTVAETCIMIEQSINQYRANKDIMILEFPCDVFLRTMLDLLERAEKGLKKLQDTYTNDITIKAQLDYDVRAFEQKIEKIQFTLSASEPREIQGKFKMKKKKTNHTEVILLPSKTQPGLSLADVEFSDDSDSDAAEQMFENETETERKTKSVEGGLKVKIN